MISYKFFYIFFLILNVLQFVENIPENVTNLQSLSTGTNYKSEMGFIVGSTAAEKVFTYLVESTLKHPHYLHATFLSTERPWFDTLAHVNTKNRVSTARIQLTIIGGKNLEVTDCEFTIADMYLEFENGYFLNYVLAPFVHHVLPRSIINKIVCDGVSKSIEKLRKQFAIEIPLISILPDKFIPYLNNSNVSLFVQLQSFFTKNEQINMTASIDWNKSISDDIEVLQLYPEIYLNSAYDSAYTSKQYDFVNVKKVYAENLDFKSSQERVQLWIEDQTINKVFDHFRWDFEWMEENIPMNSSKLPHSTTQFLSTLCDNCYFIVNVSANGKPNIKFNSDNSTIVLKETNKIHIKVVNPSKQQDAVFINFILTLYISLEPEITNGIFRTRVDLLNTEILMEKGAFPPLWHMFLEDISRNMIMDVIWPGLKKEIESFLLADGVEIPYFCGLLPQSIKLNFGQNHKFGASAALKLDDIVPGQSLSETINYCIQQIKTKLPDPNKLFVIHDNT